MTFPVARVSDAVQGKLAALVAGATLDRVLATCGLAIAAAPQEAQQLTRERIQRTSQGPSQR